MNVLLTPRPFRFYFPPPSPQFYYFSSSILFFLHHHHHRHHISIVFSSTTTTSFYCFPSTITAPTITIFLLWWWWWWRENNRSAFVNSSRVLRVRFVVVTFNPALYKVSSVLKKHLNILQSSPNCRDLPTWTHTQQPWCSEKGLRSSFNTQREHIISSRNKLIDAAVEVLTVYILRQKGTILFAFLRWPLSLLPREQALRSQMN